MKNTHAKLAASTAYGQLQALASSFPEFAYNKRFNDDELRWLGRAHAIVADTLGAAVDAEFQIAQHRLGTAAHETGLKTIKAMLFRALGVLELELPTAAQGAFIPAGDVFDAMSAVSRILVSAQRDFMIVDPYLDEKILFDFAHLAHEKVATRLLGDAASIKASLVPAAKRSGDQYGSARPLFIKTAPPKSLHDRVIIVDRTEVWTVGQSFNALAARAPTSFVKVDEETAALKVGAYESIWAAATDL